MNLYRCCYLAVITIAPAIMGMETIYVQPSDTKNVLQIPSKLFKESATLRHALEDTEPVYTEKSPLQLNVTASIWCQLARSLYLLNTNNTRRGRFQDLFENTTIAPEALIHIIRFSDYYEITDLLTHALDLLQKKMACVRTQNDLQILAVCCTELPLPLIKQTVQFCLPLEFIQACIEKHPITSLTSKKKFIIWHVSSSRSIASLNPYTDIDIVAQNNYPGIVTITKQGKSSRGVTYHKHTYLTGVNGRASAMTFIAETRLVTADVNKTLILWDTRSCKQLKTIVLGAVCRKLKFDNYGKRLFASCDDKKIYSWNVVEDDLLNTKELIGHKSHIIALALDAKGSYLASSSRDYDNVIKIWDLTNYTCIKTIPCYSHLSSLAWYHDILVSGSKDGVLSIWNPASGCTLFASQLTDKPIYHLETNEESNQLAIAHSNLVTILNFATNTTALPEDLLYRIVRLKTNQPFSILQKIGDWARRIKKERVHNILISESKKIEITTEA